MTLTATDYTLTGLRRINVILGKNGSGKSTLLKEVDQGLEIDGAKHYVTPERAGELTFTPHVEQNMNDTADWLNTSRRTNQFANFRQQSVSQFRRLELAVLRASETRGEVADFDAYMSRLNLLLDNIELRREEPAFKIFSKHNDLPIPPIAISSGEAELISLGIEALSFAQRLDTTKANYLFLDSPDVHLHPDLQARLMQFLVELVDDYDFTVLIATHSTAILGSLSGVEGTTVTFLQPGERELEFEEIGEIHRRILPVFGAHPLSNVFNEAPMLIVEGGDDERVWQQAVRSASGSIALHPVACEGVTEMSEYEAQVKRIISAVYDDAKGYSLRDRDGSVGEIDDDLPMVRMKLACRAAENLILCDDALVAVGLDWEEAQQRITNWLESNEEHPKATEMSAFRDGGFDRKGADLKAIRNILSGMILDSRKSWEVLVGQIIGRLAQQGVVDHPQPHSAQVYLGEKAVRELLA